MKADEHEEQWERRPAPGSSRSEDFEAARRSFERFEAARKRLSIAEAHRRSARHYLKGMKP